jgi:hypothetical protein
VAYTVFPQAAHFSVLDAVPLNLLAVDNAVSVIENASDRTYQLHPELVASLWAHHPFPQAQRWLMSVNHFLPLFSFLFIYLGQR